MGLQVGMAAAVVGCTVLTVCGWAQQKPNPNRPPQQPATAACVATTAAQPQASRRTRRIRTLIVLRRILQRRRNANRPPVNQYHGADRPPANNFNNANRPPNGNGAQLTPRQQVGAGAPRPWVDQMRSLTPQQRDKVLQNSQAFQNLSPDKQSKIRSSSISGTG